MAALDPDQKLCFVIGPIGDEGTDTRRHANWLLKGIIKPVFAKHFPGFKVERADEIVAPGNINSQVITRLMDAELVIADMSLHNSNAFYELAIRHMVRLPTIHMIHKDWNIPFDVALYRAIQFSCDDYDDIDGAQNALKVAVEEVIQPGFEVENPVTHARRMFELQKHAAPEVRALIDEVAALRGRIEAIESSSNRGVAGTGIYTLTGYPTRDAGLRGAAAVGAAGDFSRRPLPIRGLGAVGTEGEIFEVPHVPENKKE